ncbi:hypothetical protein CMK12_16610 [Candidatus Poribacteria bacterium]|nr:hypothetical protein [Candidatus Poribacteria bacterium]
MLATRGWQKAALQFVRFAQNRPPHVPRPCMTIPLTSLRQYHPCAPINRSSMIVITRTEEVGGDCLLLDTIKDKSRYTPPHGRTARAACVWRPALPGSGRQAMRGAIRKKKNRQ